MSRRGLLQGVVLGAAAITLQRKVFGQWDGNRASANNGIAIAWPPGRKPIRVATYYMNHTVAPPARKAVLAEAGRIAAPM